MRIGILGGTFNPIHKGHIKLAKEAMRKLKLDKVVFVPVNIPPHKRKSGLLAAHHRYKMTALAAAAYPYFEVSDYEIKKGGFSYSVRTLEAFKRKFYAKHELFFLTGADSLRQLKKWKNLNKIVKIARFVIASRPGYKAKKAREGVYALLVKTPGISSSIIRRRIKKGLSVKRFLNPAVYNYIRKEGLYQ